MINKHTYIEWRNALVADFSMISPPNSFFQTGKRSILTHNRPAHACNEWKRAYFLYLFDQRSLKLKSMNKCVTFKFSSDVYFSLHTSRRWNSWRIMLLILFVLIVLIDRIEKNRTRLGRSVYEMNKYCTIIRVQCNTATWPVHWMQRHFCWWTHTLQTEMSTAASVPAIAIVFFSIFCSCSSLRNAYLLWCICTSLACLYSFAPRNCIVFQYLFHFRMSDTLQLLLLLSWMIQ